MELTLAGTAPPPETVTVREAVGYTCANASAREPPFGTKVTVTAYSPELMSKGTFHTKPTFPVVAGKTDTGCGTKKRLTIVPVSLCKTSTASVASEISSVPELCISAKNPRDALGTVDESSDVTASETGSGAGQPAACALATIGEKMRTEKMERTSLVISTVYQPKSAALFPAFLFCSSTPSSF